MSTQPTLSRTTIGVMGSGTSEPDEYARPVGEALADLGVNLLTGGAGGVMTAVSRAFIRKPSRRGISIGVIPCASESDRGTAKAGYPNEFPRTRGALSVGRNRVDNIDDVRRFLGRT